MNKENRLPEMPKDLGIKVGTKQEVLWTTVLNSATNAIQQAKDSIIIQEEVVKIARLKIKIEQEFIKKKPNPLT